MRRLSSKTVTKNLDRLELSLTHLTKFFGGKLVKNIKTPVIKEYIQYRQTQSKENDKPYVDATINKELSALKRRVELSSEFQREVTTFQLKRFTAESLEQ